MKIEKLIPGLGLVVIIGLAAAIVWKADIIGVPESRMVEDARRHQEIDEDWAVAQTVNEDMGALLFYDEETADCAYSFYVSGEGFSTGYFYGQGGRDVYMAEDAKAFIFEDRGIAVMSMNVKGVCKIVTREQEIPVDPQSPFAVLLPLDCGDITLYDADENIVTLYDTYTG